MVGESGVAAGLTLPPKVVGKVSGHLVMKVDEVLWSRKPPGDVSAVVMWWGGEEPTTFRPTDVAQDALKRRNAGVIYEIRTSLVLFEKYLRKCGSLEIAMADKYGMPIGCVSVTNLWQMINKSPYQGYYPIVNNFGNRIGDLHVSFNLCMLASAENGNVNIPKLSNKQGMKTKELKRLSPSKSKQPLVYTKSKEEKTKRNEEVLKDTVVNQETTSVGSSNKNTHENSVDVESIHNRMSPTSNIISQILEHGTRLRDAMTASVMEDGLQLNCKKTPELNVLLSASEVFSDKEVEGGVDPDAFPPGRKTTVVSGSHKHFGKKIRDYLSGKPMSEIEEKEALSALRCMTPTKDILENVVLDTDQICQRGNTAETQKVISKESSEVVTNITDYLDKSPPDSDSKFDIDSQLLSQINCLRLTVHSLILNTVGVKRVGSFPKKKSCLSQSNISVHPPGVTYFVEYEFPVTSGSRPWESTVRYCSKRISGYEVAFEDRTVHNLPATWRSSISGERNVGSLISALSFKICARHLHQRISIPLGTATPDSAKKLIESVNLRHEFDLPVVASDHLPVAQLRVCLELGRDRIHFGGLFDPDNNSLGIQSPRKTSATLSRGLSSTSTKKKKPVRNVTTVTRNVAAKSSASLKLPPQQASQARQVIQQLVANADATIKTPRSLESSSVPSTGRSQQGPSRASVPFKNQAFTSDFMSSYVKPTVNTSSDNQFLKHEVALTILQVVGKNYLKYSTADDKGFYVTYKFPALNAMKTDSVGWHSCATEPSESVDGIWDKPQNRIHSVTLPKNESFHAFLQHAYDLHGSVRKCVVFSLCVRCYGIEVQDLPVAEATLPLTCLLTLENAYKEASRNNPNFSSSSCSSIVLELPFELLPSYQSQDHNEEHGSLRLKVDYRHSAIEYPFLTANFPRSRGDSVSENIPHHDFGDISRFGGKMKFKLAPAGEVDVGRPLDLPVSIPNWAKSPDELFPQPIQTEKISHKGKVTSEMYQSTDLNRFTNPAARNLHAAWEPVQGGSQLFQSSGRTMQSSAYLPDSSHKSDGYDSIADLIDYKRDENFACHDKVKNSIHLGPLPVSSQSLNIDSLSCISGDNVGISSTIKAQKADAATSTSPVVSYRHMSRGTSPTRLSEVGQNKVCAQNKSTSMEKIPEYHDRSQQVSVENATQASQTTPRKSNDMVKNDVEIHTNFDSTPQESENVISVQTDITSSVPPRCSINDVETIKVVSEQDTESQLSHSVKEDFGSQEKCTEKDILYTESRTSNEILPAFSVKIGVECALHLQSSKPSTDQADRNSSESYVFVSLNPCGLDGHISAHSSLVPLSISPAVIYSDEPEWNWQTEIQLPTDLLVSAVKRLIFKIWQSDKNSKSAGIQDLKSANLLGFSALDLTVLSAGLPFISGWYNIMDFSGACRGQIKLSVEPLEDISKTVSFSALSFRNDAKSKSSMSMFVAHSTYSEFPSHVTQFPDMLVQKVDPQSPDQAISAILSNYQLVVEQCQRLSSERAVDSLAHSNNDREINASSSVSLQRKDKSPALEVPQAIKRLNVNSKETSASESTGLVDVDKDPSVLLREKLSELDTITKGIKSRLLTRVESAYTTGSEAASFGLPDTKELFTENQQLSKHVGEGDSKKLCDTCACHSKSEMSGRSSKGGSSRWKQAGRKDDHFILDTSGACPEELSFPSLQTEERASYQKQRKTWEKQEDLIDFGTLHIDCKDDNEQSPQNEDLSDWLSESALQQVFNPFLFNDILNCMNSSRGVQVIELDDTGTSDDNQDSPVGVSNRTEENTIMEEEKSMPLRSCKRRSRRGDETYRKEDPHFVSSSFRHKTGPSAGDADSGVDVDVSATFRSGAFFPASGAHESFLLSSLTGARTASSEREESSSCSLSSRHHQSTFPSSASGTPSDSPHHPHLHAGANDRSKLQVVLGKRNSAACNNHSRRREV